MEVLSPANERMHCVEIEKGDWLVVDEWMPGIEYEIDGQKLSWRASGLFRHYSVYYPEYVGKYDSFYCLGVRSSKNSGYMLGLHWLQNRRVVFDMDVGTISVYEPYDCSVYGIRNWRRSDVYLLIGRYCLLMVGILVFVLAVGLLYKSR